MSTPPSTVIWKAALDWAASIAIICVCAVLLYKVLFEENRVTEAPTFHGLPSEPVRFAESATVGSKTAKVVVVMFSDFQCPYCAQFARETWPRLTGNYISTGKVLFVYKHLPLTTIHPNAMAIAVGADCSRQQGRFVEMHDRLFEAKVPLTGREVRRLASELGLEMQTYDGCVSGSGVESVKGNLEMAERLGITGTPTFLFGERIGDSEMRVAIRTDGVLSEERLVSILDHRFGL